MVNKIYLILVVILVIARQPRTIWQVFFEFLLFCLHSNTQEPIGSYSIEINLLPNFQKDGLDRISIFRGLPRKRKILQTMGKVVGCEILRNQFFLNWLSKPHFLDTSPPFTGFFQNPLENWIFRWIPVILKFFILNLIWSFKSS